MGLTAILQAIQATGEARVREIERQAQTRAQEVLVNAEADAQRLREEARATTLAKAAEERARIIHHARLEALRIVGDVREALVDRALDQTRGRLAGVRTAPSYPVVLRRLTEEALAELDYSPEGIGKVQLQADPRDRVLLESILFDMGLDLPVRYELNCWGGLIAKSEDGRLVVINTLKARQERATPYLRRHLATLFEEGQFETAVSRDEIAVEV
jgi:V/A-type H+-transporting ATPase subunit E